MLTVNNVELETIRSRYRVVVARILFEHFAEFQMFKPYAPQFTECTHAKDMSAKSELVTMPVMMKDEKKYSDQLEKWTQEIYSAAGLCSPNPEPSDNATPIIAPTSRPDQPASHVPPSTSKSDPLHGIKIPCFGDQLTRVRFAGAKDLRAGCHVARQRFDHLYPFCIVDWHTKRSFLKVRFTVHL